MELDLLPRNKKYLFEHIDQLYAFQFYLNKNIKEKEMFSNPFRKDRTPSANLIWKGEELVMVDFGDQNWNGNIIQIISKVKDCSFKDAIGIILKDCGRRQPLKIIKNESKKDKKTIEIVTQPFTKTDYLYWNERGINISTCLKNKIYSCEYVKLISKGKTYELFYSEDNPIYAYSNFPESIYKIYRPHERKEYKFLFNGGKEVQGLDNLNSSRSNIVICKSWKDAVLLKQFGINSICLQSEGDTSIDYLIEILERIGFSKITIFYDRDKQGVTSTRKIVKKYNINWFFINQKKWKVKDISDFYKKYGIEKTFNFIKSLF